MSYFGDLQNYSPADRLTCCDVPFLPVCQQVARADRAPRFRRPRTTCVVGTVSGTYSNGDPFMGEVVERSRQGYPDRVYRDIRLPNGMTFQLRNAGRSDNTYDTLSGGEVLSLDVIESGLSGTVNIHTDDAQVCRSQAYSPFVPVPSYRYGFRGDGASRYGGFGEHDESYGPSELFGRVGGGASLGPACEWIQFN